jgi:hypothetical protein
MADSGFWYKIGLAVREMAGLEPVQWTLFNNRICPLVAMNLLDAIIQYLLDYPELLAQDGE